MLYKRLVAYLNVLLALSTFILKPVYQVLKSGLVNVRTIHNVAKSLIWAASQASATVCPSFQLEWDMSNLGIRIPVYLKGCVSYKFSLESFMHWHDFVLLNTLLCNILWDVSCWHLYLWPPHDRAEVSVNIISLEMVVRSLLKVASLFLEQLWDDAFKKSSENPVVLSLSRIRPETHTSAHKEHGYNTLSTLSAVSDRFKKPHGGEAPIYGCPRDNVHDPGPPFWGLYSTLLILPDSIAKHDNHINLYCFR